MAENGKLREPNPSELSLLRKLIESAADLNLAVDWENGLRIMPLDDGGMGSFRIYPSGVSQEDRVFGRSISSAEFRDADGTRVSAVLNLDQEGELFEVDIWKVDFSPVIEIPVVPVEK
jgi:hypothetical protein